MNGGRAFDSDACFAWPSAQICAMSIEGAIDVAFRKDYMSAPDPQARRQEMIEETRVQTASIHAAEGFGVDDVIDPRTTRRRIIEKYSTRLRRGASRITRQNFGRSHRSRVGLLAHLRVSLAAISDSIRNRRGH